MIYTNIYTRKIQLHTNAIYMLLKLSSSCFVLFYNYWCELAAFILKVTNLIFIAPVHCFAHNV